MRGRVQREGRYFLMNRKEVKFEVRVVNERYLTDL